MTGDTSRELRDIKRRLANLEVNNRLANATIGGDGRRGRLRVLDAQNTEVGVIGDLGVPDNTGAPQTGLIFRRQGGGAALTVFDPAPGDGFNQFVAIFDRTGNIVVSDDTESGAGLALPWLPLSWVSLDQAKWSTTSSSSPVPQFVAVYFKQHPKMYLIGLASTDGDTTAQIRLASYGGAEVYGTADIDVGANVFFQIGPVDLPTIGAFDFQYLQVDARRTGGSGSVRMIPVAFYGTQTL